MFTTNHFILLCFSLAIIIGMMLLNKYKKIPYDKALTLMVTITTISEAVKVFVNMQEGYGGGRILDPADLPFHLCSVQIFFLYSLKFIIKNEQTKEKLLGFMAPTLLFGGIIALLIPTVGVRFNKVQVYQFFAFHTFVTWFALYIVKERLVNYNWKYFVRNLSILGLLALFATYVNSILSKTNEKVNFFYLARPPMENLPILNLNNGWYAYFFTLAGIVILLLFLFHLTVQTIYKIQDKKLANNC